MRPGSIISMETKNIHIDEQYMIGGVKTAGGKNRVIPIADCILPFIKELYNPSNEFLLGSRMSYDTFTKNYFYPVLNELNITQLLHIDPLLLQALREDIPEEEKRVFLQVLDTLYQKSKSERKTDYQTLSARVQEK